MPNIDWGFVLALVVALLIVGILNRWLTKKTTVESGTSTTPVTYNPTTIAGYNDIHHAEASCIE